MSIIDNIRQKCISKIDFLHRKVAYPFTYLNISIVINILPMLQIDFFHIGRKTCYKGWKLEYNGYLMAGNHNHVAGTMYSCVDSTPDALHGGHSTKHGKLFYLVEARCGSLKCPPYVEGRELVCAVCSKK